MYKCECGKEFDKANNFNGHKSQCIIHLKAIGKYENYLKRKKENSLKYKKTCIKKRNIKLKIERDKIRICKGCGKKYTWNNSDIHSNVFCSRSCANKRIMSNDIKQKISKSCKNINKDNYYLSIERNKNNRIEKYNSNPKYCKICGKVIEYLDRKHETCSYECRIEAIRQAALKQKYHGRSKQGWYKGFWCDSTWELVYIIYCLDHNINIKRNKQAFEYEYNNKLHKYLPDFIVNNTLIEIKGYRTELVDIKTKAVKDIPLIILYEKDLKECFDWVKNNYSYKNLEDLYDNAP